MLRAFPRRKVDVVVAPQSAFDCAGCSDLRCLATVTIFQFAPECEGNWAVWTCRHHWAINPAQKKNGRWYRNGGVVHTPYRNKTHR